MVFTTAPGRVVARRIARAAIARRAAACAHFGPVGESLYWWKGRQERAAEVPMVFKTGRKALPFLLRIIKEVHPYETPEILALRADRAEVRYRRWILEETHLGPVAV